MKKRFAALTLGIVLGITPCAAYAGNVVSTTALSVDSSTEEEKASTASVSNASGDSQAPADEEDGGQTPDRAADAASSEKEQEASRVTGEVTALTGTSITIKEAGMPGAGQNRSGGSGTDADEEKTYTIGSDVTVTEGGRGHGMKEAGGRMRASDVDDSTDAAAPQSDGSTGAAAPTAPQSDGSTDAAAPTAPQSDGSTGAAAPSAPSAGTDADSGATAAAPSAPQSDDSTDAAAPATPSAPSQDSSVDDPAGDSSQELTLSDVQVGDLVTLKLDTDGDVTSVEVMGDSLKGGMNGHRPDGGRMQMPGQDRSFTDGRQDQAPQDGNSSQQAPQDGSSSHQAPQDGNSSQQAPQDGNSSHQAPQGRSSTPQAPAQNGNSAPQGGNRAPQAPSQNGNGADTQNGGSGSTSL